MVFAICVYLAGLVWIVFGQTLGFQFINFDDNSYVYENPEVSKGLSLHGIARAFTHPDLYLWTPLTTVSHMLDCQLFGLSPAGHHLTNVLLQTAAAILLFLALRRMTGALWRSAFVAAVFAIHPLRAESVAWVAERKDVLSGVFFMAALWAYAVYARSPSPGRYAAVTLFFVLGLLAKPMLVTFPCLLLLLDYWPLRRRAILEKLPLFALSAAACCATFFFASVPGRTPKLFPLPLRAGNAAVSAVWYLGRTFYPVHLALFYPFPPGGQPLWKVTAAVLLLAVISLGVFVLRKGRPYLFAGWFWYLGMLAPVAGVIQMGRESHADRYTYLPQIGVSILFTWLAAELLPRGRGFLSVLALIALAACARKQTAWWADSQTVWRHAISVTPNNALAYGNVGSDYYKKGALEEAILYFQEAAAIQPLDAEFQSNLAAAYLQAGRVDEAIAENRKAVGISPRLPGAYLDFGNALFQKGDLDGALAAFRKALDLQPDYPEASYCLALAFSRKGDPREAALYYEDALKGRPDYPEACNNLAHILAASPDASLRNAPKAVELAERAARLTAENPIILSTLAAAYAEAGRFPDAIETAGHALELADGQGNAALAALLTRELQSYKAGSPWRDPTP